MNAFFSSKTILGMLAWSLYFCFAWGYFFERNLGHAIGHCAETCPYFVALILILVVLTGKGGLFVVRLSGEFACGFLMSAIASIAATPLFFLVALISLKSCHYPPTECNWLRYLYQSFGFGGMVISWIAAFLILRKTQSGAGTASLPAKLSIICGAMFVSGLLYGLYEKAQRCFTPPWPFSWF